MSARDWFRPSRQLMLVFLVVAVSSTTALAWLTWELLTQDRLAKQQRETEDRERAVDAATLAIERQLAVVDRRLDATPVSPADEALPEGTTVVSRTTDGFVVTPPGSLLYYPSAVAIPAYPSAAPSPALFTEALTAAERLELVGTNLESAAQAYRTLAASDQVPLRAAALARLARVERKRRAWTDALATYDRLAALGSAGVDGMPALLVARIGRASVFEEEQPDATRLRDEATRLSDDLRHGRLQLTRSQYAYCAGEIRRWLGTAPVIDADALARADVFGWLWEHRRELTARGRRLVTVGTATALVSWRSAPATDELSAVSSPSEPRTADGGRRVIFTVSAVIIGPEAFGRLVAASVPDGFAWAITDLEGRLVSGDMPPARESATRPAAATGLPWTLHVFTSAPRSTSASPRQTLLTFVLVSVAGLLVAGWYFIWRGISREARVSRLQSDFVAAVSHEFRSPLTSLRHIAELLATHRMTSEERRHRSYAMLLRETDRLGRLVEGLLDFDRLQAGRTAFRFEAVDASELVRHVVEEFGRRFEPDRHHIELTTDAPAAAVMADRDALGRALWNLLDNAVKYSPGAARIQVRVTQEAGAGRVSIAVQDEGAGIPASEQGLIFDRFVRGADAKARCISGTGIGLAMARDIVRAHGGSIALTSQVGAGSVFTVTLPSAVEHHEIGKERPFNVDEPVTH